jgi:hypothetical protein
MQVFEAVGPEYESLIKVELEGCAIELVTPSSIPTTTSSSSTATTATSTRTTGSGGDELLDKSAASFILRILAPRARLVLPLDPAATSISPSLDASFLVQLAEAVPSDQVAFFFGFEKHLKLVIVDFVFLLVVHSGYFFR